MRAACWLLVLLPAGCQGTWEAYEEVRVGRPIPEAGLLSRAARKGRFEWEWQDIGRLPLPPLVAVSSVRTLQDKAGNVVAKQYEATAVGYWLLAQAAAHRSVIETNVPEHAWRDPPPGWRPRAPDDPAAERRAEQLTRILDALSRDAGGPGAWRPTASDELDSLEAETIVHRYRSWIAPRRLAKAVRARIAAGESGVAVDPGSEIGLGGIAGAKGFDWGGLQARVCVEKSDADPPALLLEVAMPFPAPRARNVVDWLHWLLRVRDRRLPDPPPPDADEPARRFPDVLALVFMCSYIGRIDLRDLPGLPGLFRGVTREGFDRTFSNAHGGTCRIRNLGGRRIRVETNRFELQDGLMLIGLLKWTLMPA